MQNKVRQNENEKTRTVLQGVREAKSISVNYQQTKEIGIRQRRKNVQVIKAFKISKGILSLTFMAVNPETSDENEKELEADDDIISLQWLFRLQRKEEKTFLGPTPGPNEPISAN